MDYLKKDYHNLLNHNNLSMMNDLLRNIYDYCLIAFDKVDDYYRIPYKDLRQIWENNFLKWTSKKEVLKSIDGIILSLRILVKYYANGRS